MKTNLKRWLSLAMVLLLCLTMLPAVSTTTKAATINESSFATKIAQLKTVYRDKEYWNGYNAVGYEGTGTVKCYCTYYCEAECPCDCGKFYLNGVKYGGQCFGFANKMAYLVFGSIPDLETWESHGDWIYYSGSANTTFYAGDYVRVRNNAHSIFITAVNGDTVTYVDCNNYGPCQVKWDRTISTSELKSKTTYVYRFAGNTLTGNGSANNTSTNMTTNDVVNSALQLLYYNEGSYGSVNKNDNGAVSVGKIQWHGNRALNLLKTIINMSPSSAQSILGTALYNEIQSASNWEYRTVSSAEASAISQLLTTSNGKKAQDDLATNDVTAYINHGKNLGIVDPPALVYFADLENQGGAGMSSRVAKSAAANVGSYQAITLYAIHSAALSDSVAGYYASRRNQTYKFCNSLTNHTTHTYTGSYSEAAHPHKVYQQCSCGATQYTGATVKVSTCGQCNPVGTSSKYNSVLPFKAYLKNATTDYPCSSEHLAVQTGGQIWEEDECIITAVYDNGACKVKYPVGDSYKEAYTSLSNFVGNTSATLTKQTVNREIKTYIRATTGSMQYGYTTLGDVIYKLGTSGNMTQIFYYTPAGYKLAWVQTSELSVISPDIRFNPYCPIKGYPCVTYDFAVYEADHTTYVGDIWTTDYCTIKAVYADGWCYVEYPIGDGSSSKEGYTKLSNFVSNDLASPVKYTATAQIVVSTTTNLNEELGKIFAGDVFFVVGTSGSLSQVLYPLDAEYGGGYKMGWIRTSELPQTKYTVSYNANGGSGAPSAQTKTHGVTLKLSTTVPVWEGHTFVGWATNSSATTAEYAAGASYTPDANVTLYAVWTLNKYEITYNADGGTNAPATQNKTHGTDIVLSENIPTKTYTMTFDANGGTVDIVNRQGTCEFLGWATSSAATVATYQPGATFRDDVNTTLYAVWQNPVLTQYSIPERAGYVFEGWYTAANGGTKVNLSSVITSDMTVYAHWVVATYGINYDANGGTNAPAAQTKTYGEAVTLSTAVPTRENYTFLGWATEDAPTEVKYQPGDTYYDDSDLMLIAVWQSDLSLAITVGSVTGKNGDTVTVPVVISENPGIIAAKLKVSYDRNAMELIQVQDGGILGEYNFGNDLSANPYIVSWSNGEKTSDYTTTGNLVYLTFEIYLDTAAGEYPIQISYDADEIYNSDYTNVNAEIVPGIVTVEEDEPVVLPSGDAKLKFSNVTIRLEADLTISFGVKPEVFAKGAYENPRVEYSIPDVLNGTVRTQEVTDYSYNSQGRLMFPFNGISPRMMKAPITCKLYGTYQGVEYCYVYTYKLSDYCYSQLNKEENHSNGKFMTLLADLLNFGAVHQCYAGHEVDNLVNAEMTDFHKSFASTYALNLQSVMTTKYEVLDGATASFKTIGLNLGDAVVLRLGFNVDNASGVSVRILADGVEYNIPISQCEPDSVYQNRYYCYFDELMAKQMSSPIYCTVCRNGVPISSTLRYSIESYAYTKRNDTSIPYLTDLVKYMMYYGNSAADYFNQ